MVITRRTSTAVAAMIAVVWFSAGCGATLGDGDAGGTRSASAAPSVGATETPSFIGMTPCDGVDTYEAADALVLSGAAVAAAMVTISDDPGEVVANARDVSVASYSVVAGDLHGAKLQQIQEISTSSSNLLPRGSYLVLLGPTPTTGTFNLAAGVFGSFSIINDMAVERCPGSSPDNLKATSSSQLISWFDKAISENPEDPYSIGSSPSAGASAH